MNYNHNKKAENNGDIVKHKFSLVFSIRCLCTFFFYCNFGIKFEYPLENFAL